MSRHVSAPRVALIATAVLVAVGAAVALVPEPPARALTPSDGWHVTGEADRITALSALPMQFNAFRWLFAGVALYTTIVWIVTPLRSATASIRWPSASPSAYGPGSSSACSSAPSRHRHHWRADENASASPHPLGACRRDVLDLPRSSAGSAGATLGFGGRYRKGGAAPSE